jgi:cation transport regulator
MPYASNLELPSAVREHLPRHAQDIFREAFNSAFDEYADRGEQRETLAFKVAWAAVKQKYRKQGDEWQARH